ncbi:unnamed protein product [Chironomus riparius]|uniref:Spaetzle domain-containing protein n=1 Tax=Chironomus riparius TaxID=315576 RepID=A0A9N9WP13_9DIPT|nr:unnamed protein product [Chironomus riparius]
MHKQRMLSTLLFYSMLTVLIKSVNLATIPESNNLSSSEEDQKAECPEISFKFGHKDSSSDDYETTQLCKSVKKQINPNDLARERGYDVEDDKRFSQLIEVEECENVGLPCSYILPFKKTICKQKYMKIQLKVVNKEEKMSAYEDFDIPSNCECVFLYSKLPDIGSLKQLN